MYHAEQAKTRWKFKYVIIHDVPWVDWWDNYLLIYIGTLFRGMREFKYFSNQKTIDNIVIYDLALRTFLLVLQNH